MLSIVTAGIKRVSAFSGKAWADTFGGKKKKRDEKQEGKIQLLKFKLRHRISVLIYRDNTIANLRPKIKIYSGRTDQSTFFARQSGRIR